MNRVVRERPACAGLESMPSDDAVTAPLPADLADRLGMASGAQGRLDALPASPQLELPADAEARELLARCAVSEADAEAMIAARPDPGSDWAELVRGTLGELRSRMDRPLAASGYRSWPTVPEDAGPAGMFAYAWALLAVVPDLLAVRAARGIERSITDATLANLGGLMGAHHEVTGFRGVGLFPLWGPPQVFCGVDLSIGRHSFTRTELAFGDDPAGFVLQVHIPPTGPLTEAASRESIDAALAFFARHYADEPIAALVCRSWMLDPQLRDVLPGDSNILRFQDGWQLLPLVPLDDVWEDDREFHRLGLQLRTPDDGPLTAEHLARVPQDTRLQRGFVDLIRRGGHWHKRTGIRWLLATR
jgi:hypothetical protein